MGYNERLPSVRQPQSTKIPPYLWIVIIIPVWSWIEECLQQCADDVWRKTKPARAMFVTCSERLSEFRCVVVTPNTPEIRHNGRNLLPEDMNESGKEC